MHRLSNLVIHLQVQKLVGKNEDYNAKKGKLAEKEGRARTR